MFMKPLSKDDGSRARLELSKVTNTKVFEKYICTGTYLYEYAPATQTIRVHNMPQNKPGVQQESLPLLPLRHGGRASQGALRHDTRLSAGRQARCELPLPPGHPEDRTGQGGLQLRPPVALFRASHLPAQIWYLQPNKSEISWNFTKVQTNVQIPTKYFTPDEIPGWKMECVRPQGALTGPATIRPGGQQIIRAAFRGCC